MPESLDCVIVGAGVIGLAVARTLAGSGRDVIVLEAEGRIGEHSSSRNSEVIHAGIYYPEDSLKARLCVRGRKLLYRYCEKKDIPHRRIGKLIVATDRQQLGNLGQLEEQGIRNDVGGLEILNSRQAYQKEPAVNCAGALWSPGTGIIDSHAYMQALQADIGAAGGTIILDSHVSNAVAASDGIGFEVAGERFRCRTLVNAAGLWATEFANSIRRTDFQRRESRLEAAPTKPAPELEAVPAEPRVPRVRFAKGHYFTYAGRSPFSHLVYPLPSGGGLGIHATLDLAGTARFGPDVTWVDRIDYAFDESRKPAFVNAIRSYFPDLDESRLQPGYTGIRPKLHGPSQPPADFLIQDARDHGVRGLVNLFGIESPGLTASLAIGEYVRRLVTEA